MSSTIENITCPKCGGNAQSETDHKTGEVHNYCHDCDYKEVYGGEEEIEQKKQYKLVSTTDGNVEIELESDTEEDAIAEALYVLGWSIVAYKDK